MSRRCWPSEASASTKHGTVFAFSTIFLSFTSDCHGLACERHGVAVQFLLSGGYLSPYTGLFESNGAIKVYSPYTEK